MAPRTLHPLAQEAGRAAEAAAAEARREEELGRHQRELAAAQVRALSGVWGGVCTPVRSACSGALPRSRVQVPACVACLIRGICHRV
jgi:hypothetical protein